jgi:hypothetical protein
MRHCGLSEDDGKIFAKCSSHSYQILGRNLTTEHQWLEASLLKFIHLVLLHQGSSLSIDSHYVQASMKISLLWLATCGLHQVSADVVLSEKIMKLAMTAAKLSSLASKIHPEMDSNILAFMMMVRIYIYNAE